MQSVWERAKPIYVALLLALLTWMAIQALGRLTHVLLIVFVAILFAAAITGPVRWLNARWRIPRGVAAVLIYVAVIAVFAGVLALVVPPLFGQLANLGDRAPEYAERYEGIRDAYEELRADYGTLPPWNEQLERLGNSVLDRAGDLVLELPSALFALLLDLLAVLVISVLLVTNRERIFGFTLSLVHPEDRALVGRLLEKLWSRLGAYLRAKVIVMTIIGALTYVALLLLDVPFALVLALIVALGELIPRVGPWLARVPLLGIAALEGWETFLLVFAASILIQNLKGYFISPYVEGQQLDIHPLLVFLSVLVGAALGGFAGAFVAVPVAAIVDLFVREVVVPWRHRELAEDASLEAPLPPPA